MKGLITSILLFLGASAAAQDVIVIGEIHDNPHHHAEQARQVAEIAPKAIVLEMLTAEQAARFDPALVGDEAALESALGWNASGWPDFSMYYPIFAAAPETRIYGAAVPREAARAAMNGDFEGLMQGDAAFYGLNTPLPPDEQMAREALQKAAHCNALPEEMLPDMVRIQRLRDAMLAKTTIEALETAGAPVVVITGNGHARKDWGMPAILRRVSPELGIFVVGQTEHGVRLEGGFDKTISADLVERGDPCAAFR